MAGEEYDVHMISFKRKGEFACSVVMGGGENLLPWQIKILKEWIEKQERPVADDGSDLV